MKYIYLFGLLLLISNFSISCEAPKEDLKVMNSVLSPEFRDKSNAYKLIYSDLIWDGGSTIYEIVYGKDNGEKRILYVLNRRYGYPEEHRIVYISDSKDVYKNPQAAIVSEEDKAFLLCVFEQFREYVGVESIIETLGGEKGSVGNKITPEMEERIISILRK